MGLLSQLFPFLPFARYALTPPSPSDGDLVELHGTVGGALKVALVENNVTSGADIVPNGWDRGRIAAHHVVVASAATLVEASVINESAADRWLMFFDSTSAPGARAAPLDVIRVPAGGTGGEGYKGGLPFANGITWGVSSAFDNYTEAGANDMRVTVTYRT